MNNVEFQKLLDDRITCIRKVLDTKSKEYATDDRLHNFKRAAGFFSNVPSPAYTAWGFAVKHLVSIQDIVEGRPYTLEQMKEKVGDAINYLILIEALLTENLQT